LVVDPDAVLAPAVARQSFQPIAAESGKVFETGCRLKPIKPKLDLSRKSGEFLDSVAPGETLRSGIAVAQDHAQRYRDLRFM
jgi:hypothetical protein